MKSYKHLSQEDRYTIYVLWNIEKRSMSNIAKVLNKNKSTISRELKRNVSSSGNYYSRNAHRKYIRKKIIVIYFACENINLLLNFFLKNLIKNAMV